MKLFDGHCDTAYELWTRGEGLERNSCHIDLQKAAGLEAYAQVFAFCSNADRPGGGTERLLTEPLALLCREVEKNRSRIGFAANGAEALRLTEQGRIAALLSVEGCEVIGCDPGRLEWLREQGFCMLTLTWNADNALAGWHGSALGLTPRGRDFVREAQRLGLRIDVSHLSEAAFWQLMDCTQAPILASHSNCRVLCDCTRNLTDDQLCALAQTGGTVGLNLYPPFLGGRADFDTLRAHLEHMLTLCGEDMWPSAATSTAATSWRAALRTSPRGLHYMRIYRLRAIPRTCSTGSFSGTFCNCCNERSVRDGPLRDWRPASFPRQRQADGRLRRRVGRLCRQAPRRPVRHRAGGHDRPCSGTCPGRWT